MFKARIAILYGMTGLTDIPDVHDCMLPALTQEAVESALNSLLELGAEMDEDRNNLSIRIQSFHNLGDRMAAFVALEEGVFITGRGNVGTLLVSGMVEAEPPAFVYERPSAAQLAQVVRLRMGR